MNESDDEQEPTSKPAEGKPVKVTKRSLIAAAVVAALVVGLTSVIYLSADKMASSFPIIPFQ